MLVLTRKVQEQIQIGDNVTVTILRVKGKAVSVGIDAPPSVRVVRSELVRQDEGRRGRPLTTPAGDTTKSPAVKPPCRGKAARIAPKYCGPLRHRIQTRRQNTLAF